MSIPDHARANFQTLLCAVGRDGADFLFTPFGHLADGNPYDAYVPPSENLSDESAS
jgi:hypothetical protein